MLDATMAITNNANMSASYGYNSNTVTWNTTVASSSTGPLVMTFTPQQPTPTKEPPALEWLREQVDEICQLARV